MLNNPCPLTHAFSFEITFECLADLSEDLEWNVVYVGSAESSEKDQILESVEVGPVPQGVHKFVLESTSGPDIAQLQHVLGVTVVLVTCTYREEEFVRIGYYVNNEIPTMDNQEEPNESLLNVSTVVRTILADKPRVTRFPIQWDDDDTTTTKMSTPFKEKEDFMVQSTVTCMEDEEEEDLSNMAIVSPPSTQQQSTMTAMEI